MSTHFSRCSRRNFNTASNTGENTEVPRQKEWDKQLVKLLLFFERPKSDEGEVLGGDLAVEVAVVLVLVEADSTEEGAEVVDRRHRGAGQGLQANTVLQGSMDHDERISLSRSWAFFFPFTHEKSLMCSTTAMPLLSLQISKHIDIGR